jgi:hypothetical protein
MSPFAQRAVLTIGILLGICGLIALGYALWPLGAATIQEMLSATVFAPP